MSDQYRRLHPRYVLPSLFLWSIEDAIKTRCFIRCLTGEYAVPHYHESTWLIHPQLRSDWDAASQQCAVLNTDSSKPQMVVRVIIDIVLLLIALVGLLRLRRDGGGKIGVGLGLFLWKQVGFHFPSIQTSLPPPVDTFSVLQGTLWLLIALLAEVPPAVSSASSFTEPPFAHHDVMSQVFIILNLNGIVIFSLRSQ